MGEQANVDLAIAIDPNTTPLLIEDELQTLQHEVQRLLGRCVLRLQQYERLIKTIVAHCEISGTAHDLGSIRDKRIADAANKMLGTLVGNLFGYVILNEIDTPVESPIDLPEGVNLFFSIRTSLSLSSEDFARTENELKELVSLRNHLVHHFIDQHDLRSMDGCRGASDALVAAYSHIDQHFKQLRDWAENMDQVRRLMAAFLKSDAGRDLMLNDIAPDGTVHWPVASIVCALREAAGELAVDGWTPVAAAKRWIAERYPEQLPAKYGCRSWRQVVHESRLFELHYRELDGHRNACYREKGDATCPSGTGERA